MVRAMATPTGEFLWNLDANVGRRCPNNIDDVELVRYGFACLRHWEGNVRDDLLPVLMPMKSSGAYGPDLQAVIDLYQKQNGGTQDGHVSKLPPNAAWSYDKRNTFIMIKLNEFMQGGDSAYWPRIDRSPISGALISRKVMRVFRTNR